MHRSASMPPVAMSPRWYALPASMAHHCGPLLGRTVQPRTPGECRRRDSRSASPDLEHRRGDKRSRTPTANATAEISIRAHTPGSAGALAGMIFRASTDLSITGKRSHNPPDHDDAFAPIGRRGRQRSQDEYPRPTGRNSRSATPDGEHHRGESRSASPNREDHRGHRRSATHPREHRRPRRHDLPCLNQPSKQQVTCTQPARSPRRICPHGPARAPAFPGRVPTPNWPKQQVSLAQLGTPSWRKPVSLAQS